MEKQRVDSKKWVVLSVVILVFLASILLVVNQFVAQADQTAVKNIENSPQPDVKFNEMVYDFGTIQQGEKVVHMYRFKNKGQAPFIIESIKTSCGCTVPKNYTKKVLPGKEGHIEVIFNSKNFLGNIRKTITVRSNDPDEPGINLSIKGMVIADVVVAPPRSLFGLIKKGQSPTRRVVIKQGSTKKLEVT